MKQKFLLITESLKFILFAGGRHCFIEPAITALSLIIIGCTWWFWSNWTYSMLMAYISILLMFVVLIRLFLFFPMHADVILMMRMVYSSTHRQIGGVWLQPQDIVDDTDCEGNLPHLKLMLIYWLIVFVVTVTVFAAAYDLAEISSRNDTEILTSSSIPGRDGDDFMNELEGLFDGFFKSVMNQVWLGANLDRNYDINHEHILAILQVCSTLLLFTIALLLIQQRVAQDIHSTKMQKHILSYVRLSTNRVFIRASLLHLVRDLVKSDDQGVDETNLLYRSKWENALKTKRLVQIEEFLNIFLLEPKFLLLFNKSLTEELQKFLADAREIAEARRKDDAEYLAIFCNKINILRCHLNLLKQRNS